MTKEGQAAYTLVELLVTLAMVSVLATAGVSGFADFITKEQTTGKVLSLRSFLNYARYQAVQTQQAVTVCGLNAADKCSKFWDKYPPAVFVDSNRNHYLDDNELLLRQLSWQPNQGQLRWKASLGRNYLIFNPMGNTWQNGTLYYCPPNADTRFARAIVVNHGGRNFIPQDSDNNGIMENGSGKNLQCPL